MSKPHVLYLSYDGLTDPLGQSQILPYLAGLSQKEYRFTIISYEKPDLLAARKERIQSICAESEISWIPLTYTKEPPVFSTIYDIDKLYRKVASIIKSENIAFLHCRSYITSLVALRIKKKFGTLFIFDMRGFWADERVDGKIWDLENPVYKRIYDYFKNRERRFLEDTAAVVSLTQEGKKEIGRWFNEDGRFGGDENYYNYDNALAVERKTSVIPCATDLNHFQLDGITEQKKKWLRAVYGLDDNLEYLGYVGSLGTWYKTREMVELYREIHNQNPKVRLLILTHDNDGFLREVASVLKIPTSNITVIRAERKEVPALMSLMAASVFFILPAYSKKASSPTKQGELMAMGVPIICNDGVGDTGEIIRKYNAGMVISQCNPENYHHAAQNWKAITSLDSTSIRHGAEEYFSLEKGVESYHQIYQKILSEKY